MSAGLTVLLLWGCAAKVEPYEQQVQRVTGYAGTGAQWFSQGDLKKASREFQRALEASRAVDYRPGVAQQLNNLGAVALEQGDLTKARDLFTQAWRINQELQNWADASTNLANLATVAQEAGDRRLAGEHLKAALEAARKSQARPALARVLCRLASLALDQGELGPRPPISTRPNPWPTPRTSRGPCTISGDGCT